MTRFFLTLATLTFIIVSCNKMQKTPSGLEYKIFKSGGGDKIAAGDFVFFKVVGKVGDSALYNTYKNLQNPYMQMPVRENFAKGNFEEGLTLLGKDDSALFKINADSFFRYVGAPTPAFIKKGESINFYVKVDSFITKKEISERKAKQDAEMMEKEKNEPALVDDYVKATGLKFSKTASGLYYNITKTANGPKASKGDTISALYTGKFFDGRVFDSSDKPDMPFQFVLGAHEVIAGWDEIFAILHQGEKATIVVPSAIAYGTRGNQGIPPFTPLVFDVELIKVSKSKK